jgi:hypothetical protein
MIVNGVGEMIGWQSRRLIAALQEYDVVNVVLVLYSSSNEVNELNTPRWTIRRAKADRKRLSSFETTLYLML